MEYEFINDPITGKARANFSLEHQVFGPWLEVEVGNDIDKIYALQQAVELAFTNKNEDKLIVGSEYNVLITSDDVIVSTNASENDELPDNLSGDELDFDGNYQCSCGIDDFSILLSAWINFIK